MPESGYAVEVNVDPQGSELDSAAVSGDTVLHLGDASAYDPGTVVEINGVRKTVRSTDTDAATITLTATLGVAAAESDRVFIVSGGTIAYDYTLAVQLADGSAAEIPIPFADRSAWAPGPVDPPVPVTVSDDLTRLLDVPGATPTVATELGVEDGGTITVRDANGNVLMQAGTLDDLGIGFKTYRDDGTVLFESVGSGYFGLSYSAIRDRLGGMVVRDDPVQNGLARPRISLGQWVDFTPLGTAAAPTTSATFTSLQVLFGYEQSPAVRFDVYVSSPDALTTGEVRVLDPNGVQIGSPLTVPPNANTLVQLGPIVLPGWPSYDLAGYFTLQARRTGGAGAIGARGMGAWGVASFDTA